MAEINPLEFDSEPDLQRQSEIIEAWLADTTEEFDDWDWDGEELLIFLNGDVIERYPYEDLLQIIPELAQNYDE